MDETTIGIISAAGVILTLAVIEVLPRPVVDRLQEGAKWFMAALFVSWGVVIWIEDGRPEVLVFSVLTVGVWLGRRIARRRRREPGSQPHDRRSEPES